MSSVSVKNLTKIYGDQRALDGISFEAPAGQILGFLGPNGAGKTTTMKILTCYLSQSSGSASVFGHDVETDSLEVRKLVGYLPEHNPLYKDMYVREYLAFAARANKLSGAKARIEELIEMTGLGRESHKLIGALSKGSDDPIERLKQRLAGESSLLVSFDRAVDTNKLKQIKGVSRAVANPEAPHYRLYLAGKADARAEVFRFAVSNQLVLLGMQQENLSVEEVFRALTS